MKTTHVRNSYVKRAHDFANEQLLWNEYEKRATPLERVCNTSHSCVTSMKTEHVSNAYLNELFFTLLKKVFSNGGVFDVMKMG